MTTLVQSLQQVGDEIALCRYPGAVIETLHAAVRPTLNVLGAWRVPRRYEDWSAWRLNYNVFCHRDLPATFFDAWLAGARENGQSAMAAMATREGRSFTWSECMREVNLSAKGRWVFDDLLFKYGMRDGFCCPIGPWILHYWSNKVLDLSPAMRRSLSWAALTAVDQLMKLTTKKRLDAALPASRLTDREREVLRMYAIGSRARTIAYALKISEDTVREHLRHAMIKLDARHLGHAVNLAYHGGLLD